MSDSSEEEITSNWVLVNPVDVAEEATILNKKPTSDNPESDNESDGISVISESSHLQESTQDEESTHEDENPANKKSSTPGKEFDAEESALPQTWTYVNTDEDLEDNESSNQFYLNCMQEPVQELSENELGSIQSDMESDGISIISDCESLESYPKQLPPPGDGKQLEEVPAVLSAKNNIRETWIKILMGTIIVGTSIWLAQRYLVSEPIEEEVTLTNDEFNNEINEELKSKHYLDYTNANPVKYCKEKHKKDDLFEEVNVKKCLKIINLKKKYLKRKDLDRIKREIATNGSSLRELKNGRNNSLHDCMERRNFLKVKEDYLKQKEKFLVQKEYELIKAELKILREAHLLKIEQHNVKTKIYKKNCEPFSKRKNNQDSKSYEKRKKHDSQEIKRQKGKYHDKKSYKTPKNSTSKPKKTKLPVKNNDQKNPPEKKIKKRKSGTNLNFVIIGNSSDTISGIWYSKLYQGRKDVRKKEHSGDWLFERAYCRKLKRNKANWYFQLMMNREGLRYKQEYKPFCI